MPWLIQHQCNEAQGEPQHYAISRGVRDGLPLTKVACGVKNGCREEFFIVGHEMFTEAHSSEEASRRSAPNLPPGFVIARTKPRV